MRLVFACAVFVATAGGCAVVPPPEPRCVDLDAETCDSAWDLAQPHLRPTDGEMQDALVGRAGGAAECHPVRCPEMIAATVYYRSGVEVNVIFEVAGDLRVVDTSRIERATPVPEDGGKELPSR